MEIKIPYYEDNTRISRSFVNWFLISPRYAKDKLDGKVKEESSSAMDNGTAKHMYLLQPEEFKESYKILDFETPSSAQQKKFAQDYISSTADKPILKASEAFKANYSTNGKKEEDIASKGLEMALKLKSYIKWLRGSEGKQKILTWAQYNSLKLVKENVILHKKANELLYGITSSPTVIAENEFHINWEYKTTEGLIVKCKSLLDRLVIDLEAKTVTLIDLKTTISSSEFHQSYKKYGYGMQMAYYWCAVYYYMVNELKLDPEEFSASTLLITIENRSSEIKVLKVPDEDITKETQRLTEILKDIAWHIDKDQWDYTRAYYEGDGIELLLYDIGEEEA